MAEAWSNRRILVCQNMDHVETMYPLINGTNVVYCRPDLSDLVDVLEDIECNFAKYAPIAEEGYFTWRTWAQSVNEIMREGFSDVYKSN
jgi:hypothetical protein